MSQYLHTRGSGSEHKYFVLDFSSLRILCCNTEAKHNIIEHQEPRLSPIEVRHALPGHVSPSRFSGEA